MIAFATVISLGVMYYNSIPHNCPADKGFSIEAALDDAQSKPALTVKLNDPLWEEVRFPLMKIGPVFDQEIEIKFRDGHKLRKRCIDLTEPERKRLTQALEAIANSAAKESTKPNR